MNASEQALHAYTTTRTPVQTPRNTEHSAFEKVTARLVEAARATAPMTTRAAALHDNRKLWTLLAADVADAGNALPQQLRAQLFYLAEFTLLHSRKALSEDAPLAPLIDINTAVMRGLRGEEAAA